jgi:hypothetical protein
MNKKNFRRSGEFDVSSEYEDRTMFLVSAAEKKRKRMRKDSEGETPVYRHLGGSLMRLDDDY